MSNINELKDSLNTKTLNLVLLSIATGGIYPLLWIYKNTSTIERITKNNIASSSFTIWIAVCVGLGSALAGSGVVSIDIVSAILTIASWGLYIVWAFKARKAVQEYALHEHKIDLKTNAFYTILFTFYYVNYCINDLPEAKRKQNILAGNDAESVET